MAEHDGAAEETESLADAEADAEATAETSDAEDAVDAEDAEVSEPDQDDEPKPKRSVRQLLSGTRGLIAVSLAAVVTLGALAGWLGYRYYGDQQTQERRALFVQVARQTAINLTTIDHAEVDADIKRVLDSVTGAFHEEYENRSKPFIEVVKKVQSKTEGNIAEAGIVSATADQAQVLVAVAVKTSLAGAPPDQEPRRWRMRLTVDRTGDSAKVSKVEFVP